MDEKTAEETAEETTEEISEIEYISRIQKFHTDMLMDIKTMLASPSLQPSGTYTEPSPPDQLRIIAARSLASVLGDYSSETLRRSALYETFCQEAISFYTKYIEGNYDNY